MTAFVSADEEKEECCGSGCNYCVLDKKQLILPGDTEKISVLTNAYTVFKVVTVNKLNCNVLMLEFKYNLPDNDFTNFCLSVPPGSHLMLRAPRSFDTSSNSVHKKNDNETEDIYISRPYTPINVNITLCSFEIIFKLQENGAMSNYVTTLKIDGLTEWKGPYAGAYENYRNNDSKALLCIGQGVGISPLYSIIDSMLSDEENITRINFITCFKDFDNILLRNKIYSWKQFWNFEHSIYLSREGRCSCNLEDRTENCDCIKKLLKYNEKVNCYRLEKEHLLKIYKNLNTESVRTLICGSTDFCNYIKNNLVTCNCNIDLNNIIVF